MSQLGDRLADWAHKANSAIHSSRGKDVLVFLLFLLVSYVFWLLLTLNNEVQEDIDIPFELVEIPDSVTLISDVPTSLSVSVRDKGTALARYVWADPPVMKLRFADCRKADNRLLITESEIDSRLRNFFGQSSQIVSSKPDSISIYYTSQPGRRVKVLYHVDAVPNLQYVISGPISADVDSVTVYSVTDLPSSLRTVETVPVVRTDLRDSTYVDAKIVPVPETRIVPDHIRLCIPVEPLISKRRTVPVTVIGVPHGSHIITFPSKVEINYLIPMSKYAIDDESGYAAGEYESLLTPTGLMPKLGLHLSGIPDFYHNVSMVTDSVEYIIEQKQ